jgi:predicted nucleotidyltransferase
VLEDVPRRLAPLSPRLVVLFGSRATGDASHDSDYDLLVVMHLPEPRAPRSVPVRRPLRGLGVPFDIVVYSPEEWDQFKSRPQSLAYRIAREGRVLHGAA